MSHEDRKQKGIDRKRCSYCPTKLFLGHDKPRVVVVFLAVLFLHCTCIGGQCQSISVMSTETVGCQSHARPRRLGLFESTTPPTRAGSERWAGHARLSRHGKAAWTLDRLEEHRRPIMQRIELCTSALPLR